MRLTISNNEIEILGHAESVEKCAIVSSVVEVLSATPGISVKECSSGRFSASYTPETANIVSAAERVINGHVNMLFAPSPGNYYFVKIPLLPFTPSVVIVSILDSTGMENMCTAIRLSDGFWHCASTYNEKRDSGTWQLYRTDSFKDSQILHSDGVYIPFTYIDYSPPASMTFNWYAYE